MIRAVVWKEVREQGLIAVLLAVLGGGLLIAAATFADPPSPGAPATDIIASLGAGKLLSLMLVATAGMVCGGALFAAEREAGTLPFLDALPTPRWPLWRAKIVAGLSLAAAVVAALLAVTVLAELGDAAFLRRLLVYALLAFAWGAFGSAVARTTLGAVGVAVPAAVLSAVVCLVPIYLFLSFPGSGMPRPVGWVVFEVLMIGVPLTASAWRFTAPDRARRAAARAHQVGPSADARPGLGVAAVAWLTVRQLRHTSRVLSVFALGMGLLLLRPEMHPIYVFPALALIAGVLCGVIAFGDEQVHRTGAFWGDYRLPIGRAWWVKLSIHLMLLAWLLFLLAAPGVIRTQIDQDARAMYGYTILSAVFSSRLFVELGSQGWKYVFVPAVYGFAFGHVCGLLFKKPVVAAGVAAMLGGTAAAAWGPSLLAGGTKHWQVWLPAAVVLLTGRLIIRAWTADRLGVRGPVLRLVGGAAAAVLALGIGLGVRVVEVPNDPTGGDDAKFVQSLPSFDENLAGVKFRAAAERYVRTAALVPTEQPRPGGRPRIDERIEQAARGRWPDNPPDPELAAWLDRVFTERTGPDEPLWTEQAEEAAALPVGVYDPPTLVNTVVATAAALDAGKRMGAALLARGRQLDAAGDPAAFPPLFRTVTALARTLRRGGGYQALGVSIEVERNALLAADAWLERNQGRRDLLTAVARFATDADEAAPFDPRVHILADRYVTRAILTAPNQWLTTALDVRGRNTDAAAAEADLVALAWAVPWERERTRRLIGLSPNGVPRAHLMSLTTGRPGNILLVRTRSANDLIDEEAQLRVLRRIVILRAAVSAFQTDHKRAPAAAADLVAGRYLARLPEDPFAAGRPMNYRVSDGESLVGLPRAAAPGQPFVVPVQAGQAVVWSVGPDGIDQGGKAPVPTGPRAEDLVYLVPAPR